MVNFLLAANSNTRERYEYLDQVAWFQTTVDV